MIRFESLNKEELQEYIRSGKFSEHRFLPITAHRAISHTKNPKAEDKDILLTLAFWNDELAGYLGTLPDQIKIQEKTVKFAWLSTLYISEKFRGKKIAQNILNEVFQKYGYKIAITEFTKEAESLYLKTKLFSYIEAKNGMRYYLKAHLSQVLPQKKKILSSIIPVLKIADFAANRLHNLRRKFSSKRKTDGEILEKVDRESAAFLESFKKNRETEDLNWIMENPWVLEGEDQDTNYLFSSYAKEFRFYWVKLFDEKKSLQTCAMLQLRDGHLKIPYLFSRVGFQKLKYFLRNFCEEHQVHQLTVYHPELNVELTSDFPTVYRKKIIRKYMMMNPMLQENPELYQNIFQDGDGDCVFT